MTLRNHRKGPIKRSNGMDGRTHQGQRAFEGAAGSTGASRPNVDQRAGLDGMGRSPHRTKRIRIFQNRQRQSWKHKVRLVIGSTWLLVSTTACAPESPANTKPAQPIGTVEGELLLTPPTSAAEERGRLVDGVAFTNPLEFDSLWISLSTSPDPGCDSRAWWDELHGGPTLNAFVELGLRNTPGFGMEMSEPWVYYQKSNLFGVVRIENAGELHLEPELPDGLVEGDLVLGSLAAVDAENGIEVNASFELPYCGEISPMWSTADE